MKRRSRPRTGGDEGPSASRGKLLRIAFVDPDPLMIERMRASLRGGPFHVLAVAVPPAAGEADLQILRASAIDRAALSSGIPAIGHGPAGLLRSAFLAGCADYLREPWSAEELGFRALAVIDRSRQAHTFPWGALTLEGTAIVTGAGRIELSAIESRVLRQLLACRGAPVPRDVLALRAWGRPARQSSRSLDMHVSSIRRKLLREVPAAGRRFITAVRCEGYMIP